MNSLIEVNGNIEDCDVHCYIPERYVEGCNINMNLIETDGFDYLARFGSNVKSFSVYMAKSNRHRPFVWIKAKSFRSTILPVVNVEHEVTINLHLHQWLARFVYFGFLKIRSCLCSREV